MKKLFTILAVVALTTTVSFAQVQWGATAGLNFANVSGADANDETAMRLGIRLGVSAEITLTDVMNLNTGALYSVKGYSAEDDPTENNVSFNYIEIPLHVSFAVSDVVSLQVGPYLGLVVGSSITMGGESYTDYETSDLVAGFDLGLTFGTSFNVSEAISIDAGYQIGLTTLDPDGDAKLGNSNILIGMTYLFGGRY